MARAASGTHKEPIVYDDNAPMTESDSTSRSPLAAAHRWIAILVLGFASGLPLALTGQALQAWLTDRRAGRRGRSAS